MVDKDTEALLDDTLQTVSNIAEKACDFIDRKITSIRDNQDILDIYRRIVILRHVAYIQALINALRTNYSVEVHGDLIIKLIEVITMDTVSDEETDK